MIFNFYKKTVVERVSGLSRVGRSWKGKPVSNEGGKGTWSLILASARNKCGLPD